MPVAHAPVLHRPAAIPVVIGLCPHSSLCPLTTCVPLYVALCLLLMSSRSDRTSTPKSGCPTPVTVALSSLYSGDCPSFPPSPLTPPFRRAPRLVRPVSCPLPSLFHISGPLDYPSPTPSSPPSCHGPITTCARPRSLLLDIRLSLTLSCIQRLTTPLLRHHYHRPLSTRTRPCRFRVSARPPMTVSCIQRLPTPLLRCHRHHPITTCACRRSFRLSGRLLAPLLWGALHCHCPVTSHYSVHVVS